MARVIFTSNLQRHVSCPETEVVAQTLGAALQAVFAQQPRLRGYVMDEQGALRKHIFVFVDGRRLKDRSNLDLPVSASCEIHVMQALTGG